MEKEEEKKEEGGFEWSAGPEGTDDLCFHTGRNFLLLLLLVLLLLHSPP